MATKKQNSDQSEKPQNAYFLSLELENVRCFGEKQRIDFSDGEGNPKQWTIILGDNGSGKTTILQSLVAISPVLDKKNEYVPKFYKLRNENWSIGRHNSERKIRLVHSSNDILVDYGLTASFYISNGLKNNSNSLHLSQIWLKGIYDNSLIGTDSKELDENIVSMIFAYGASRKVGETSLSEQSKELSFNTLFDETILLTNPEEWLIRSNYESLLESEFQEKRKQKLSKIIETLIQILPDIINIRFGEKTINNKFQPIVEFETPYGLVEAKDLSLGYRTSMAWMVDFASRMFDLYPDSENPLAEPAVVLIDEIDLHLHPKWQRDLLDWLSNLFPNTQFIVTTHSPLIVQSAAARDANFAVCRREGDHVVIDQSLEAVKNWRADQILTSDLFGLETARPKEIEQDLLERQQILSKAKLTKKDEKRLKEIEAKVGSVPMMENPLYDKMMDVIFRASEKLEKENKNGK